MSTVPSARLAVAGNPGDTGYLSRMGSLSSAVLLLLFLASAGVIWLAGIKLSDNTDVLAERLHLGSALGGLVLLAIATNLPEIAITASATVAGQLDVAVGNILGGIAIQTVVLVVLAWSSWALSSRETSSSHGFPQRRWSLPCCGSSDCYCSTAPAKACPGMKAVTRPTTRPSRVGTPAVRKSNGQPRRDEHGQSGAGVRDLGGRDTGGRGRHRT